MNTGRLKLMSNFCKQADDKLKVFKKTAEVNFIIEKWEGNETTLKQND